MKRSTAYLISITLHVYLAIGAWALDIHTTNVAEYTELKQAAQSYEANYRQTASATYADRLKRMNDLINRINLKEREKEQAQKNKDDSLETNRGQQTTAKSEQNGDKQAHPRESTEVADLWEESRGYYNDVREHYVRKRAKKLTELTGLDMQNAIEEVQAKEKDVLGGQSAAPNDEALGAFQIEQMDADAQRMFGTILQSSSIGQEGMSLSQGSPLEIYKIEQNGSNSPESKHFDSVVDYTPLMISECGSHKNSILDTPEDRRRIEKTKSRKLKHFLRGTLRDTCFTNRLSGANATKTTWIAPKAWYIIGPFPNKHRSQIETHFPPELEINRDAVYEGLYGDPITWHYTRNHSIGIIPPEMTDFAVYYAYTEINCAKATDCWLAIGSDDYSKLWVNDILVWCSSKNEKNWFPDEGFRRVHLTKGINRFLFRLENGINGCIFSVLISEKSPN